MNFLNCFCKPGRIGRPIKPGRIGRPFKPGKPFRAPKRPCKPGIGSLLAYGRKPHVPQHRPCGFFR